MWSLEKALNFSSFPVELMKPQTTVVFVAAITLSICQNISRKDSNLFSKILNVMFFSSLISVELCETF